MQLYVKFDTSSNTILAGPQGGGAGLDGWYPYIGLPFVEMGQATRYELDDTIGAVLQIPDGEPAGRDYRNFRVDNYPEITEQLDALFHDIESGNLTTNGKFYTALKAIKDAYPKP